MGLRRFVQIASCAFAAVALPAVIADPAGAGRDRTSPTAPTDLRVTEVTRPA
jgi:hypothetical protein